ncbi:general substrate transporter, partial [Sistotremastrum niveocremeum HHB9708]
SFTQYGSLAVVWSVLPSFQYGWHISALNMIHDVMTCHDESQNGKPNGTGPLPSCIPMNNTVFSVVTASFTVGGLVGSLMAGHLLSQYGRKGALKFSSGLVASGAALMTGATSVTLLLIGRTLCGAGAGLGICVVPIFLSEIAPLRIRGGIGVLNQLAICFGILITQALGMYLAAPSRWRLVLSGSSLLSIVHLAVASWMVESPVWLKSRSREPEAKIAIQKLWRMSHAAEISDPLLEQGDDEPDADDRESLSSLTVRDLISSKEYRQILLVAVFAMIMQQISGINAVLYYSNQILARVVPNPAYVSLGITVVNVVMTFPAIHLIEKLGRRRLMIISSLGVVVSLLLVGFGIDFEVISVASLAIIIFVASFAVGLGPTPYVIITDISPPHVVGAMSTIALSLNWIVNFFVGIIFLPLRDALAGEVGDEVGHKGGRVFYVFAVAFFIAFMSF